MIHLHRDNETKIRNLEIRSNTIYILKLHDYEHNIEKSNERGNEPRLADGEKEWFHNVRSLKNSLGELETES